MALAINKQEQLSNMLRFLLFETGIAFSPQQMDGIVMRNTRRLITALHETFYFNEQDGAGNNALDMEDFIRNTREQLYRDNAATCFYRWDRTLDAIKKQLCYLCLQESWQIHLAHRSAGMPGCETVHNAFQMPFILINQWSSLQDSAIYPHICDYFNVTSQPPADNRPNQRKINVPAVSYQTPHEHWNRPGEIREILQYNAAFRAKFKLHWLAIEKKQEQHPQLANRDEETSYWQQQAEFLLAVFPEDYAKWTHRLHCMGYRAEDFWPMLMHPAYWRRLRQSLENSYRMLLIPYHQTVHAVNQCGQLTGEAKNSPLLLFSYNKEKPQLNREDCRLINKNYRPSVDEPDRVVVSNLLHQFEIQMPDDTQIELRYQCNPLAKMSESFGFIPASALIHSTSPESWPALPILFEEHQMDPFFFFKKYSKILIIQSLAILENQGIALSLDAASCLLNWQSREKWIIEIHNPSVRKLDQGMCSNRDLMEQVCAHWQYHLFNLHLMPLIEQLQKIYNLKVTLLWQHIRQLLVSQWQKKLNQNVFSKIIEQNILHQRWAKPDWSALIAHPPTAEYQLKCIKNPIVSGG